MKRYIKPQIEILNTNLSEDMLQTASSQEPAEVEGGYGQERSILVCRRAVGTESSLAVRHNNRQRVGVKTEVKER